MNGIEGETCNQKKLEVCKSVDGSNCKLRRCDMPLHEEKVEKAQQLLKEGVEKARKVTEELNTAVKKNPLPFLAGTAAFFFLLGFFIKGSRKV